MMFSYKMLVLLLCVTLIFEITEAKGKGKKNKDKGKGDDDKGKDDKEPKEDKVKDKGDEGTAPVFKEEVDITPEIATMMSGWYQSYLDMLLDFGADDFDTYYTDNAVLLMDGAPVQRGKLAVVEFMKKVFSEFAPEFTLNTYEAMSTDGITAYGFYTLTTGGENPTFMRSAVVWQKREGSWMFHRDHLVAIGAFIDMVNWV